ncbi:hypothetical protein P879_01551 [Paragonimus westermani]|uniref:Rho-GAP domain-containing protein n=1 Tax=Paragonimus westermani TaxID=34504 RepID=A0A8T0DTP8_9TREM|nr:hypothetical protein P879_01551 [Paragonimus westermani]
MKYRNRFEVAVHGLYSTWITGNILAMSRPSTRIIKTYNIIQQFKEKILSVSFKRNKACQLQSSSADLSDVNKCAKGPNAPGDTFPQGDGVFLLGVNLLDPRFENISPRILEILTALLTITLGNDGDSEVKYWKNEFNTNPNAFSKLENGNIEPGVLSKLLFDWLKELKNPVLRLQDLLVLAQDDSKNVWEKLETLEKPVVCTLVLIARFLGCLQPLPADLELTMIRRFVEPLLQLDNGDLSNNYPSNHLPTKSFDFSRDTFSGIYAEAVSLMQTLTKSLPNSSGWKNCEISTSMFSKFKS